jgi:Phytanoyl-CoA dioxygenase (PhyH)
MTTGLTAEQALNLDFWKALEPTLCVEGAGAAPEAATLDLKTLVDRLRFEGYLNVPGVLPLDFVERLRSSVLNLNQRGIPLAFAFVYDEFWQAFQGVSHLVEAALGPGYKALPDFWVWCVLPSEASLGWGPHRDKVTPTLDRDNSPHSLTVWLPFSDATPLNGCIYILPAHLDERFKRRVFSGEDNNQVRSPQDIRALPASAGSVLAWNQAVLHWGGRASRMAEGPRVSAAFEFQRGNKPAFNTPLLDPKKLPPFRQRLGLIGKQVLQYKHMYPLSEDLARLAETLSQRFMPGAALR